MRGRSGTAQAVKAKALTGKDIAAQLAQDEKFRKQVVNAVAHGAAARRRVRSRIGRVATVQRLVTDEELRSELRELTRELGRAWARVERTRERHRARNTILLLGLGAAAAWAVPKLRSLA